MMHPYDVYDLYVRPATGCSLAVLFAVLAWQDLHGAAQVAVIGVSVASLVLFITRASQDWAVVHQLKNHRYERPVRFNFDEEEDDEPYFDAPPRVFGDD